MEKVNSEVIEGSRFVFPHVHRQSKWHSQRPEGNEIRLVDKSTKSRPRIVSVTWFGGTIPTNQALNDTTNGS